MTEILLTGFLLFTIFHLWFSWRKSLFLSPAVVFLLPASILLVIPFFIFDKTTISSVITFGLTFFIFITVFIQFVVKKPLKLKKIMNPESAKKIIFFSSMVYLACSLVPALDGILKHGILGVFTHDRLNDYFDGGILNGGLIASLRFVTEWLFYFWLGSLYLEKRYISFYFLLFLQVYSISIYANTRLSVILPLFSLFAFIAYQKKFTPLRIFFICFIFSSVLPWYVFVTNAIRHGIEPDLATGFALSSLALNEIDYEKYVVMAEEYTDSHGFEYGKGWFLGSIGNVVPRIIWQDKPVTSTSNRFTEIITGEEPSVNNPIITFTILGEGYLQLGYFGVVVELFFCIFVIQKIYLTLMSQGELGGSLAAFNFLVMSLIFFRAEIPFIQYLVIYLSLFISYSAIPRKNNNIPLFANS